MVKLMAPGCAEPWSQLSGRVQAVKGIADTLAFSSARKEDEPNSFPVCPLDTAVGSGEFLEGSKVPLYGQAETLSVSRGFTVGCPCDSLCVS